MSASSLRLQRQRVVRAVPHEIEPTTAFTEDPKLRLQATLELERLRPLLEDYDPRMEPVRYYTPPPEYGLMAAKFIGYSLLGAITLGMGWSILSVFGGLFTC